MNWFQKLLNSKDEKLVSEPYIIQRPRLNTYHIHHQLFQAPGLSEKVHDQLFKYIEEQPAPSTLVADVVIKDRGRDSKVAFIKGFSVTRFLPDGNISTIVYECHKDKFYQRSKTKTTVIGSKG